MIQYFIECELVTIGFVMESIKVFYLEFASCFKVICDIIILINKVI